MNIVKKLGKGLLILAAAALLVLPVGALFAISAAEKAQYAQAPDIVLEELAYGDICEIIRQDVKQTVTVSSCEVVSTQVKFIELSDYPDVSKIRLIVDYGDQIRTGDVIGYYEGAAIEATETGIIRRISLGTDSYILLDSLDDLAISCYVDESKFQWRGENVELILGEDVFRVARIDAGSYGQQGTHVLLTSDTAALAYGSTYSALTMETGRVFSKALVVDKRCVYYRSDGDGYFVRVVSDYGKFLGEYPVEVGYSNGKYICISARNGSAIHDGMLCDAGYKQVLEGRGGNE